MKTITASLVLILCLISIAYSELVYTPIGLLPTECIHHVPTDTKVARREGGGFHAVYPDGAEADLLVPDEGCLPQRGEMQNGREGDGWQAWTTYKRSDNKTFDSMLSKFTVPENPKDFSGGVIFIFPGLQNYDWIPLHAPPFTHDGPPSDFDIIQPVLQYGMSAGGGGDYWALGSWYVTVGSGIIVSDLYNVKVGEVINSTMQRIEDTKWLITATSMTTQKTAAITADKPRLTKQPWAYITLEVYGINGCESYPDNTSIFTDIELQAGGEVCKAIWVVHGGDTVIDECPGSAKVVSPTAVTLGFK